MKSKFAVLFSIGLLLGCSSVRNLPTPAQLPYYPYGSAIKLWTISQPKMQGELIAIDESSVYLIDKKSTQCKKIPLLEVDKFEVFVAKPKSYAWTMLLGSAVSVTHGFYLVISLPVNLIGTAIVTGSARNAYRFDDHGYSLTEMKQYARFPQGLPPGVDYQGLR